MPGWSQYYSVKNPLYPLAEAEDTSTKSASATSGGTVIFDDFNAVDSFPRHLKTLKGPRLMNTSATPGQKAGKIQARSDPSNTESKCLVP